MIATGVACAFTTIKRVKASVYPDNVSVLIKVSAQ
jgi:hypothetical protein